MSAIIENLKTAAELVEKAADLVREASKESFLPSESGRQFVREHVARIRLKLMFIRHDLATLHATANRRKPHAPKKQYGRDEFRPTVHKNQT